MLLTENNYKIADLDHIPIQIDWNKGDECENRMHSIHAYPAKFPAFITTKAIQHAIDLKIPVNVVADIFCGCGTVAYETVRNGKHFWGCDINPVATLIAETKSQAYDNTLIERYLKVIVNSFKYSQIEEDDIIFQNERISYWFDNEQICDLAKLKYSILNNVLEEKYKKFFLCAFSNILKSCSRWLTKSIKPQIDPDKKAKNVMLAFNEQVLMMKKANAQNHIINDELATIETTNFLKREIERPFVDLVITSPPYVTSYEYADLHQLSTLWLGFTADYKTFREGTIGSLYHSQNFENNIKGLNSIGRDIVFKLYTLDKSKARAVAQYYADMQKVVNKMFKMLNPGGACLFVIGNTEYKGVKIDNARHLIEALFAEEFYDIDVNRRKISNKILTPFRDKHGKFTTNKNSRKIYSEEFIIFARKRDE